MSEAERDCFVAVQVFEGEGRGLVADFLGALGLAAPLRLGRRLVHDVSMTARGALYGGSPASKPRLNSSSFACRVILPPSVRALNVPEEPPSWSPHGRASVVETTDGLLEAIGNSWNTVLPDTHVVSPDAPLANSSKEREWFIVDEQMMRYDRIYAARRAFDDLFRAA